MTIHRVAVFGASGVQGRCQALELARRGYAVRAISRSATPIAPDIESVAADYADTASVERALADVDAVFMQAPALADVEALKRQFATLADSIRRADVEMLVFNSSMWSPDTPCGEPAYDSVRSFEQIFERTGLPLIIFRPTLFMNNLNWDFVNQGMLADGVYRYAHKPDLAADWVALEDLARLMVAALLRPDLVGRKFRVGGPQRLTTLQMLDIVSAVIGQPIRLEYITPRECGAYFWALDGGSEGAERDHYLRRWESFYDFNHNSPSAPFTANSSEVLAEIPMNMRTLDQWCREQSWAKVSGIT